VQFKKEYFSISEVDVKSRSSNPNVPSLANPLILFLLRSKDQHSTESFWKQKYDFDGGGVNYANDKYANWNNIGRFNIFFRKRIRIMNILLAINRPNLAWPLKK